MSAILRQSYLERIERYLGKDTIIILTGQRRIGKSYILRLFKDKVSKDAGANVIFIDKEKHEFDDIKTYQDLNAYIDERRDKAKTNYILVDEIQEIEEFEKSMRSYYEEPDIEMVVTGSNSKMLSSDLSTLIGGRYKEIYIQALSYEEFMLFHQLPESDITSSVIINYTKFLSDAYLIHKVNRYDIHGKKLFESNDKFYFEDNGLRNALAGGTREGDIEKVIENIIYNYLIRLGYEVTVGQLQAGGIDFVCNKPKGQQVYVQASYIIADDATRKREFGNLRAVKDNYPKYVISMTPLVGRQDSDGITHLHLRRFLTEGLE